MLTLQISKSNSYPSKTLFIAPHPANIYISYPPTARARKARWSLMWALRVQGLQCRWHEDGARSRAKVVPIIDDPLWLGLRLGLLDAGSGRLGGAEGA